MQKYVWKWFGVPVMILLLLEHMTVVADTWCHSELKDDRLMIP